MPAFRLAILAVWVAFGAYWIISAAQAKRGTRTLRSWGPRLLFAAIVVGVRVVNPHGVAVRSVALEVIGAVVLVAGLGLAVWARIHLGVNWGMPMTEKAEPELVTSGPYRLVRHPIYSGLLLALLGTALAESLYLLVIAALLAVYFVYSATVEERNMTRTFPTTYPSYRERTKMLVPFVL